MQDGVPRLAELLALVLGSFFSETIRPQWCISIAQGGTASASLMEEAVLLLQWVEAILMALLVVHVAGKDKVQANFLSYHKVDLTE